VRVMLLVTDHERGGTPLRLARLARALRDVGVDVFAGCLAPPGPLSAELAAAGIPTFACGAAGAHDWAALWRLAQHVRRIRPDLIHATLLHANVAARLVGLLHRVPVVTATATIEVERRWHAWAERLTGRMDRGHIVNSAALAGHVVRTFWLPWRHVHVVPPSLDLPSERPDRAAARAALGIPDHEFVVAWVGRFDPVKRLDLVVRCAEMMTAVPCRFLLAGDGPYRETLERIIGQSAARPLVHLLGWCDDLRPVLSAADAFLFPSLTEGMPNAVLEALAAGLPVVASNLPALRQLSCGQHLVLVDGDQPRAFADALLQLHGDEALRRAIGARAAAWAHQNLHPQATVRAVLRVYEQVLGRSESAGRV
jgi:glycosyltransferase involved in cell wall biosynthesis